MHVEQAELGSDHFAFRLYHTCLLFLLSCDAALNPERWLFPAVRNNAGVQPSKVLNTASVVSRFYTTQV